MTTTENTLVVDNQELINSLIPPGMILVIKGKPGNMTIERKIKQP